MKQDGPNGLEGWTVGTGKNYRDEWMNSNLVVRTKGGKVVKFRAEYAFIDKWGFADNNQCVVIRSINAHGPFYWQKYEIKSGKLIADYYRSKDPEHIPAWVSPFLE